MRKVFFLPYIIAVIVIGIGWYIIESYKLFELLGWCRGVSIILITLYNIITVIKAERSQKVWMSMKFHIGWGGLLIAFWLVMYAEVKGDEIFITTRNTLICQVSKLDTKTDSIIGQVSTAESRLTTKTDSIIDQVSKVESRLTTKTDSIIGQVSTVESRLTTKTDSIIGQVSKVESRLTTKTDSIIGQVSTAESRLTTKTDSIIGQVSTAESRLTAKTDSIIDQVSKVESRLTTKTDSIIDQVSKVESRLTTKTDSIIGQVSDFRTEISLRDSQMTDLYKRTLRISERVDSLLSTFTPERPDSSSQGSNNNSSREP